MSAAQEQLERTLRASVQLRKELADRLRALNRSMTLVAVEHAVDEVKAHYADLPEVVRYLDAVRADVIDSADAFSRREGRGQGSAADGDGPDLSAYEVNVIVDAGGSDGTPIVTIDHPTYNNLVGRIDHLARMGTLLTDYRLIKAGVLHRANGGYLLIDAAKLLVQPFAWDALKRALTARRDPHRIDGRAVEPGLDRAARAGADSARRQGGAARRARDSVSLLQAYDPDFGRLFRVVADLVGRPAARAGDAARAGAVARGARASALALLPPSRGALARLIDHGARLAGDATRLTASVQRLLDVLMEADHLAARGRHARSIEAADVDAAIAARRQRAQPHRTSACSRKSARDMLMIATSGEHVGQVNGLMVFEVGERDVRRAGAHQRHHAPRRRRGHRHPARDRSSAARCTPRAC